MFDTDELLEHNERLLKFARKLTANQHDADDLLQSTLLRALEKKELFKSGTSLYSWASKIMFNLFVSGYRRKVKFETQYDPEPYIEQQFIDATQDTKIEVQDVGAAMNNLSADHKEILVMVCVNEMSYADVAQELDVPVGTVRSRLSRARDGLQKELTTPQNTYSPHTPHHSRAPSLQMAA
jgi:RNA polymerase sigma-70 factor (ECF subfamily)